MYDRKELPEKLVDEYSLMLLNWAYKKLGKKEDAQELVQNVWLEVFSTIYKNQANIDKPENFIWKIAHFVWCHYLRENKRYKMLVPVDDTELADETDFVTELAENEQTRELIAYMRKKVVNLNYLQREILISFYIDRKPQCEIAARLGITQATVKWYLYDTRKKLKEEITTMEKTNYVYRPRELHIGINGQSVAYLDTEVIENSLTKQNICIECYRTPKTLDALAQILGIPKAYIEFDIKWLFEKGFIGETKQGYSTLFTIESAADEQAKYAVYLRHKATLSDVIINELIASEEKIRSIGFYGSDKPFEKLLWLLIYRMCDRVKRPVSVGEPPVRSDGGKYFPLGFDRTDFYDTEKVVDTSDWMYNGAMCNDNFWWFGLYNFGRSKIENMLDEYTPEWKQCHEALCTLISSDFDISAFDEQHKYELAKLAEGGFVRVEGNAAYPNFCIFTTEQYKQLEKTVFDPIEKKIACEINQLADEFAALYRDKIPSQLENYYNLFVSMALADISYITTIFAFNDGKLYVPRDARDGEFLTLMYIKCKKED